MNDMNEDVIVTFVRVSFREASQSERKDQQEKVLRLLRDRIHVHGLIISQSIHGIDLPKEHSVKSLMDIFHRIPDPRMEIEFFDKPEVAESVRREIAITFPQARVVWWQAQCSAQALEANR
jgi:hypothetical protein